MPQILDGIKLDFRDVSLMPKRSQLTSRSDVNLNRECTFKNSKAKYSGIPIIASNMDTVGTFEMAETLSQYGLFTTVHKHYSVEEWKAFAERVKNNPKVLSNLAVSSGSRKEDLEKMHAICDAVPEIKFICLDVANGYSEAFVDFVRRVRAEFPSYTIFAGNVVTKEMVEQLILSGADVVKVGIGPGSVCTTRKKTGVGYPQLSAVLECADAAHGKTRAGFICTKNDQNTHFGQNMAKFGDGGITCPGDVAKAFCGGADFVMIGGLFAGHDQSGGEIIEKNGKKFKHFYGMSSATAMVKHHGTVAEYRASEGKTVEIPYRGDVRTTVQDILGGLRSSCTYIGAQKLKEMPKRATFIRVQMQTNEVYSAFDV
uniref:GMP reductase n=1 Tax=Globodera rostochiensis TaxID=31243 RepID=A0A914I749_GLORO